MTKETSPVTKTSTSMHDDQLEKAIGSAIEDLQKHGFKTKKAERYTFGDIDQVKAMFKKAFTMSDKTVTEFQWCDEYDAVCEYLTDTRGRGLAMFGSVGRGKTIILMYVLPIFFRLAQKIFKPEKARIISLMSRHDLHQFTQRKMIIGIDELGRETSANDFGVKHEAIEFIIDECESEMKLLFLTSNMTLRQLEDRYGLHIRSRVERLCKIVAFTGQDLRPKQ